MGGCSVVGCNNDMRKKKTPDSSFHKFPRKNLNITKQWIDFCKKKTHINVLTARICSLHFVRDDFENNMKFETGFTAYHFLKPDAVPTVYLEKNSIKPEPSTSELSEKKKIEIKKEIVSEWLEVAEEQETVDGSNNTILEESQIDELTDQVYTFRKVLREENDTLKKKLESRERTIKRLKAKLTRTKLYQSNVEKKLLQVFTMGQIKKLRLGMKSAKWAEEDIARSITLYSASSRAYKILRKKNFPLPAIKTLQKYIQNLDMTPGLMMPITKIMKAAQELTQNQKLCILSFCEMKIKETYCYDRSADTTLNPASYVQVAMLRGLVGKWKQPIFYNFDFKMTKDCLFKIVDTVKSCGFTIVAISSDLGGANRQLYTELNVIVEKPWFLYKNTKIYVFADVPRLVKLLRNYFIDHGFLLNGNVVQKDIIMKLLSLTSDELNITHKISAKSLNVVQAERHKAKLAIQLFSNTVAKAISRAVDLLQLEDDSWDECYKLFKYTNDWFDVMNSRSPRGRSSQRVSAYGLHLESQNKVLDNMTEMVLNMRVVNRTALLPFQRDIVQSNNALKLLQQDVRERFNVRFIMTYRLNLDALENCFEVIRSKDGLPDEPDRQEFKYRLKSYIVGRNNGVISKKDNDGVNDTPNLGFEEALLSGNIFKVVIVNKRIFDDLEPEENLPLDYDGFENLAGYICHRLKDEIPNLEHTDPIENNSVDHLDEGRLSRPNTTLLNQLAYLENVYNAVNGEGLSLYISPNYIQHLLEVTAKAKIDCDERIQELFFRSRMYFRISKLNRELLDNKLSS